MEKKWVAVFALGLKLEFTCSRHVVGDLKFGAIECAVHAGQISEERLDVK